MKIWILIPLAIIAGAVLPIQAALNGKMGKAVGDPIYAAFISFVVGSVGLLIYLLATRTDLHTLTEAKTVDWSVWLAGILGSFYVACVIILAPKLGVALTFGLVIAGQLGIAIVLDHFGLLGIPKTAISWQRIIGTVLIIIGVVIIRKS